MSLIFPIPFLKITQLAHSTWMFTVLAYNKRGGGSEKSRVRPTHDYVMNLLKEASTWLGTYGRRRWGIGA